MITNKAVIGNQSDPNYINTVIQNLFSIFMIIGVIYFLWHFIFAGYHLISTEGDAKKIEEAHHELTYSLLGLGIVFIVFAVLKLVGTILGIQGLDKLQFTLPSL